MEPFSVLEPFSLLICQPCGRACLAGEAESHLRTKHKALPVTQRATIVRHVRQMPGVYATQAALRLFELPKEPIPYIPLLEGPFLDGLQCTTCSYIARQPAVIQKHFRTVHQWQNDWTRGGDVVRRAQKERPVPWRTRVPCQRFFRTRAASAWFEVIPEAPETETLIQPPGAIETAFLDKVIAASQNAAPCTKTIENPEGKLEPNPWLKRVGWAQHLATQDRERLHRTASLTAHDGWGTSHTPARTEELQRIWTTMEATIRSAQQACAYDNVGSAVLFEANRRDLQTKPRTLFDARVETRTLQRYTNTWKQIIGYLIRTMLWEEQDRPPYIFTAKQEECLAAFRASLSRTATSTHTISTSSDDEDESDDDIDADPKALCCAFLLSLVDHALPQSSYESGLLSGLAVLGLRDDGGWLKAEEYTGHYSAIIKIARMLAIYQATYEVAEHPEKGLFALVRHKVQRYLTTVPATRDPTPLDWVFESRSYGLKIRYTTAMAGRIHWQGSRVQYRHVSLTIEGLAEMLHLLVRRLDEALSDLLLLSYDDAVCPTIPWHDLVDDVSEDRVGYWCLDDAQNEWANGFHDWLVRRILQHPKLKTEWLTLVHGELVFRTEMVDAYLALVDDFRRHLLVVVHLLGGQPGRTTEILGLRFLNTSYGSQRNIFVHKKMVCLVTAYHKGYNQSNQVKIIHRYLPREVGDVLLRYLWLVRPFCVQLDTLTHGGSDPSPFLWSTSFVRRPQPTNRTDVQEPHPVWPSDKMRRCVEDVSLRQLGTKLNISTWRHISIAIVRRYLHEDFIDMPENPSGSYDDSNTEDEGYVADNPWDTQSGHTSYVGGMVYGRDIQEGYTGLAVKQEQYRRISIRWHRFFNFGGSDRTTTHHPIYELFESERRNVRFQRLAKLQQIDLRAHLAQLLHDPEAAFRGNQQNALEAVVRGYSPIVYIASTGSGKTITFMLPSYCAPEGITIVIVPYRALAEDHLRRCRTRLLSSAIWSPSDVPTASLLFITPESFTTKSFRDYLNRLTVRQQLDRIVLDECHTILDTSYEFRPQFREIGPLLQSLGTQLVFLTATLPPRTEPILFTLLRLPLSSVSIVRGLTTRPNIAYAVYQVSTSETMTRLVERILAQTLSCKLFEGSRTKVIVYCQSRSFADTLSTKLQCLVYHARVGENSEKSSIVRQWCTDGGVIVATCALGVGIDVPNVRCVVHAGLPRSLTDFSQESGRAGRDGNPAKSILLFHPSRTAHRKYTDWVTPEKEDISEYVRDVVGCRRTLLDRVLDGRVDRTGCGPSEEACDLCRTKAQDYTAATDDWWVALERQAQYAQQEQEEQCRTTLREVDRFRSSLRFWGKNCCVCLGYKKANPSYQYRRHHGGRTKCPRTAPFDYDEQWATVSMFRRTMEESIRKNGGFRRYGGCSRCGVPQMFCQRWKANEDDGGSFREIPGATCPYGGVLLEIIGYCVARGWETDLKQEVLPVVRRIGIWATEQVELEDIVRHKVRWGGIEANGLCLLYYAGLKILKREKII